MAEDTKPDGSSKGRHGSRGKDTHADPHGDTQQQFADGMSRGLIWAEDVIYGLTAALLGVGALVILCQAIYELAHGVSDDVAGAIETSLESLLIVFILVELLAAVRVAVLEHELVAEPFLLVGILAAIKELVVLSTFKINEGETSDTAVKIGVLGGIILLLAAATWILRRREREPKETEAE